MNVIWFVVATPHVIVGINGGLIVTLVVVVHPPRFLYSIVAEPPVIPVISPEESTDAIAGVKEVQGVVALGNREPSICNTPPAQVEVPFGVLIVGNALT